MNKNTDVLEKLITASIRAYNRGLQYGDGGNVSARLPDEELMYVTASGGSLADVTVESFIVTDFDGNVVSGEGKPTREVILHGYIYKNNPEVGSVVHTHSPYAITWASYKKELPRMTLHSQLKMNSDIPVFNVSSGVVPVSDMEQIGEVIKDNPKLAAFLLVDHGLVAMGSDPINAEHNAQLIEETAKIAILKLIAKKIEL